MTVAVLGEALVDLIASDDGSFRPHLGGSPYNVAIGLARQGVDVSYLSPLSEDGFGDQFYAALQAANVQLAIRRRSSWPTSLALVTLDDSGQASYRIYREGIADKDISFDEIRESLPPDLRIFHTGSLAITPSQLPKIRRVVQWLRERGVLISMDINIRLGASIDTEQYLKGVRSLLREADIVKASDEDLAAFGVSASARESAEYFFQEMEAGILVLTEGTMGAVLYHQKGTVSRGAYPVRSLVDTVGAGDTFHSAFLAQLYRQGVLESSIDDIEMSKLESALEFACAAAAINVSRAGCSPPTYQEVRELVGVAG